MCSCGMDLIALTYVQNSTNVQVSRTSLLLYKPRHLFTYVPVSIARLKWAWLPAFFTVGEDALPRKISVSLLYTPISFHNLGAQYNGF